MDITSDVLVRWIERYTAELADNKEYLTQLDSDIGDSDHGINMDRGFRAVAGSLPDQEKKSIDGLLKAAGMTLIKTVGGASGPLYGTIFLRMAASATGKETLSASDLGALLAAGQKGIVDRGKAKVGDATMLDTWEPAVRAYEDAVATGENTVQALQAATHAAEQGMKSTIPLVARKGRASYLGERSVGHQDPGATSSFLFFHTLLETLRAV
ncbi:MAG: dihydroxyacetone kinase subunit DhaL [Chloroflexota bacterium]